MGSHLTYRWISMQTLFNSVKFSFRLLKHRGKPFKYGENWQENNSHPPAGIQKEFFYL